MLDATPLLRLYTKRRLAKLRAQNPAKVQEWQLLQLVQKAKDTRFGRDHSFDKIQSVADFQAHVPLRNYEDMRSGYWGEHYSAVDDCSWPGRIPFFAITSGTTSGVDKFIPCTWEMVRSNQHAAVDLLTHHLANRPKSRVFGGKTFMLGSSTVLAPEVPGVFSGELSGIAANTVPFWARSRFFPPPDLAALSSWEEKMARMAEASIGTDIRGFGGIPSWMLIFLDKMAELGHGGGPNGNKRSLSAYPNLEILIHGGVNFAPYRRQFEKLCEGTHTELREVYTASEGFLALQDKGPGEGLRMLLDTGLFFEFIPLDELDQPSPTRHWIGNAKIGVNYALALSTCAGIWSYVLGDTVKLIERNPARLLVTGRTSYMLSTFGEHLIGEQIETAVALAAETIDAMVSDYSVGSVIPEKEGELGGHLYIVEFRGDALSESRLKTFRQIIDKKLIDTNEDYKAHRSDGFGLNAPEIWAVPPNTFAAWMKSRGKLGGQNKVPRIINDIDLFQNLRDYAK